MGFFPADLMTHNFMGAAGLHLLPIPPQDMHSSWSRTTTIPHSPPLITSPMSFKGHKDWQFTSAESELLLHQNQQAQEPADNVSLAFKLVVFKSSNISSIKIENSMYGVT